MEKKVHNIVQCILYREQEQDSHKQEVRSFEERIANFKQQLMKERDKSLKVSLIYIFIMMVSVKCQVDKTFVKYLQI